MGAFTENNSSLSTSITTNMVVGSTVQSGDILYANNITNASANFLPTPLKGGVVPFTAYVESDISQITASITSGVVSGLTSMSIAALVGGGWVVTYIDSANNYPKYVLYDSTGVFQSSNFVDTLALNSSWGVTSVCALSGGGFSVGYYAGLTGSVKLASFTVSKTGTWSASVNTGYPMVVASVTGSAGVNSSLSVTGVGTNSVAIAYTDTTMGYLAIYNSTGGTVLATSAIIAVAQSSSLNGLAMCTLSNGNFAYVVRNTAATIISLVVFSATGMQLYSLNVTSASVGINNYAVAATATLEGTIIVGYTTDQGKVVGAFTVSNTLNNLTTFTTAITDTLTTITNPPLSITYNSVTKGAVFASLGKYVRTDAYGNQLGYSNYLPNAQLLSPVVVSAVGNQVAIAYSDSGNLYFGIKTQNTKTVNSYIKVPTSAFYTLNTYDFLTQQLDYAMATNIAPSVCDTLPSGDIVSVYRNNFSCSAFGFNNQSVVVLTISGIDGTLKLIRMIGGVTFTSTATGTARCKVLANGNIAVILHNPTATTGGIALAILNQQGETITPMFMTNIGAGFSNIAITAMSNGNFAIVAGQANTSLALRIYNNVGTQLYTRAIYITNAINTGIGNLAICSLSDSSLVIAYSAATLGQEYIRLNAIGVTTNGATALTNLVATSASMAVSPLPNGDFAIVTGNGFNFYLDKYSSTNRLISSISYAGLNTTITNIAVSPTTNNLIISQSTGSSSRITVIQNNQLNASSLGSIGFATNMLFGVTVAQNGNVVITTTNNTVAATLATMQINIPLPLVGVALSSANAGDTIPVAISGNITTRLDWGLNTTPFNYLSYSNGGIKGTVIGNSAILDRSRNSLN